MFRAMAKVVTALSAAGIAALAALLVSFSAFGVENQQDPATQARLSLPGTGIIPAERLADWASAGVPGGIPTNRTKLINAAQAPYNADNTGAADAQPAIMKAIAAAQDNEVVYLPAGTYRINSAISVAGGKSRITIRGDGPDKTIIMGYQPSGSIIGVVPADGGDWWYADRLKLNVTGSPTRNATVLAVGDTKGLEGYRNGGIGEPCQLSLKNDPKLPVVAVAKFDYMRRQVSRIVAKTPATVTISPGLLFDLPAELAPVLRPAGRYAEFVGIEDLAVDGANSKTPHALVGINAGYACWVKNVTVRNAQSYHVNIDGAVHCEVRHCYIAKRRGALGPNGAGILFGLSSFCLIEDNVLAETFPHIEVNGSTGNVFAYNFCDDTGIQGGLLGCTINSNHCAHCSYNLYEGNLAPKFQSDGYHGSASHDTAFRNWFHGTSTKTGEYWVCVNLNRFTRCYSLVGNVLGSKGAAWLYDNAENGFGYNQHFIYVFGMPNMGNGGFTGGKVQPGKGTFWSDWEKYLACERGKGPGPSGFQELDLDVKATTLLKGNYNYKDNGVPESESLSPAALPKSLYLKDKPAWFGNLNWPAFGPDTAFEKNRIPAQVRFEALKKGAGAVEH